ncbi:MAG: hypothetical protein IJK58_09365, partial [Clostridia bacterium]|nr:hypothetical protein [Clostridia bacterium]
MKKLLSFVIVTLMMVSSIVPAFAYSNAADVPVPEDVNTFSVWAEDTTFDPETQTNLDVYVSIANNRAGLQYLKFFVIYPECLTLKSMSPTGLTKSKDLTSSTEHTTPDSFFTKSLCKEYGYTTDEQIEARTHELLDGKKWTSPLFDMERTEEVYDPGEDENVEVPVDMTDNGRILRLRFTYDASLNPTGKDLEI